MEREQIIKALECCAYGGDATKTQVEVCLPCPYFNEGNCTDILKENALSLINELNEENERLRGFNSAKCEDCAGCTSWKCDCANIEADTVRKMHFEIQQRCIKGGIYPVFVGCTVDKVAYEMTGDEFYVSKFRMEDTDES